MMAALIDGLEWQAKMVPVGGGLDWPAVIKLDESMNDAGAWQISGEERQHGFGL